MPERLRILLAEDDALVGLAAEDVLREAGDEVALVGDGAAALMLVDEPGEDAVAPAVAPPVAVAVHHRWFRSCVGSVG
jgi:CheY-like chemotaxis protein